MRRRAGEPQLLLLETETLPRRAGRLLRLRQLRPAEPREGPQHGGEALAAPGRGRRGTSPGRSRLVHLLLPSVLWRLGRDSLHGERRCAAIRRFFFCV